MLFLVVTLAVADVSPELVVNGGAAGYTEWFRGLGEDYDVTSPNGVAVGGAFGLIIRNDGDFVVHPEVGVQHVFAEHASANVVTGAVLWGRYDGHLRLALGPSFSGAWLREGRVSSDGAVTYATRPSAAVGVRAVVGAQLERLFLGVQLDGNLGSFVGASATARIGIAL